VRRAINGKLLARRVCIVALMLVFIFVSGMLRALPSGAEPIGITWEQTMLPVSIDGRKYNLEALLLYPDDNARQPLVIISHGSPRAAADRATMTAGMYADQMLWYVRRGWTAAVVLRRGFGHSEGGWAEDYGSCQHADYFHAGLEGAKDIAASIEALAQYPNVDISRTLAVGVSAGAFATVALTSNPPPQLVAGIVFAPGRGSLASDQVCDEDDLVSAFGTYGKKSPLPLLWISASNDHWFGPAVVGKTLTAFNAAGGHATFFAAPAFGEDGHYLFESREGITIWEPTVENFLSANKLTFVESPLDLALPEAITATRSAGVPRTMRRSSF
jgi:dienelactone hydrolase